MARGGSFSRLRLRAGVVVAAAAAAALLLFAVVAPPAAALNIGLQSAGDGAVRTLYTSLPTLSLSPNLLVLVG